MALLSRVGLFCFCWPESLMPLIDIVTMRDKVVEIKPRYPVAGDGATE